MTQSLTEQDVLIRIGILEKLVDRLFDSVSKAELALKTSDKALHMAQEALALMVANDKQQDQVQPLSDLMSDFESAMGIPPQPAAAAVQEAKPAEVDESKVI